MPPDPPLPVSAQLVDSTDILTVTFDKQLQAGSSAIGNWRGDAIPKRWVNAAPLTIAGNTVSGLMLESAGFVVGPVVRYYAAPADVIGVNGLPVAAFSGFPLSVV